MDNIDLNKYTNYTTPICTLANGGEIIAQEVDQDNNLIYIIRDPDNSLRAAYAVNEQVADMKLTTTVHTTNKTMSISGTV